MKIFNGWSFVRLAFAAMLTLSAVLVAAPAQAASERALYLYYTHTKETARIVFKRNGQYVQSGLNDLNYFLRDWRRNEPTQMDPRLFDLVWEVYQEVGGTEPINIVSAYRSPATNEMLRETSSGVAENSQHTKGHAMDFFIPGVSLSKLRAAAMRKQVGGVGYYPTSGSPFVHLDTGSVRAWPRMTRAQLKEIFPDGRTMHLPTDGTPLSQEGYQVAMAEWKRCHSYPCNGSGSGTQVAGSGRTLVDMIFGGNNNNAAPAPAAAVAAAPVVQTAAVAPQSSRRIDPVMPSPRPADLGGPVAAIAVAEANPGAIPFATTGSAPLAQSEMAAELVAVAMPVTMPDDLRAKTATTLPSGDAVTALAAFTAPTMPTPRVIMTNPPAEALTAYLPTNPAMAGPRPLEMITGSTATASAAVVNPTRLPPLDPANGFSASAFAASAPPAAKGLFEETFGATENAGTDRLALALAAHVASAKDRPEMRRPDLVAPDLEHVAEVFIAPASLQSNHFAVIFDHDEADFDPTPEMGRHVLLKGVGDMDLGLSADRFSPAQPVAN